MTAVQSIYPNGIFTWTDRVDQVSIDFANDSNSLASEIISIEGTLGTTPEIEPHPPYGNAITYATVSSRITDAMNNSQMIVCSLTNPKITLPNNTVGQLNTYNLSYDPFNMFNGVDITIPANGWWLITATQTWSGWEDGYSHFSLCLNGTSNIIADDLINWEFPGNNTTAGLPGRWQQFGARSISTAITWQGLAHAGDRFSGLSENGTSNAAHVVTNLTMKASMLRKVSGTFTSG